MLVSQAPGGVHERFFEEIGEGAADGTTRPVTAHRETGEDPALSRTGMV